ncbi:MAG: monovalent cation/H(+) antiporter subunit G [Chloroflexi bacterium]|nr:monovalent cation/H(+) antiporter subunit G [Chloroflexota bacterium]
MIRDILGLFFLWSGVLFSFVGVLGLIRLPDVFTRLHAAGKVAPLGMIGLLIGAALLLPGTALKMIALAGFLFVTAPVASHAIAAAAHLQDRGENSICVRDDLADTRMSSKIRQC